jgi:apolipoprotein N-acyltransferase
MLLIIWMAAWLTAILGYCAALAIVVFGLYEVVRTFSFDAVGEFSSDPPLFMSVGPMIVGCGLQALLVFLFVGVLNRFEDRCWKLINGHAGPSIGEAAGDAMVSRQADGDDSTSLAAVRARRSKNFAKRLRGLIDHAWPPPPR